MNRLRIAVLIIGLMLVCTGSVLEAKDTEFEFYYQAIEKVVQINNPNPQGPWETAKSLLKSGINSGLRFWERAFGRSLFTGEGSKRWYSRENSCIAYDVRRVKVRSEAHLLQLMGAETESDLSDGQKAMLAVYRHSRSQAINERHQYGYISKVKVILSDTSGFEDQGKYPHVRRDFWPFSQGSLIMMSTNFFSYPGSEDNARSTFVHEYSHSMDRTIKEFISPYGKDGTHYTNELTKPRSAFVEGWAEFNEMLDSEYEVKAMKSSIKNVRIESKTIAGDYQMVSADNPDLSGADLLSVEGINAMILYRLANEVPDGRKKIFETFSKTNWKIFRSLSTFSRDFARRYPEDAAKLAEIIDSESKGRFSETELIEYAGDSAGMRDYLKTRNEIEDLPENFAQAPETMQNAPQSSMVAEESNLSAHDFSVILEKTYNELQQAQNAYLQAVESSAAGDLIEELQKKLSECKQKFDRLKRTKQNKQR